MTRAMPAYLPARYHRPVWHLGEQFDQAMLDSLRPGMRILDLGSGRGPALWPKDRPPGVTYAGLDISLSELKAAPPGSYDEMYQADATRRVPELESSFDLVVSFQVFEHVKPLDVAFDNMRAYLKPGGRAIVQMSGTWSVFGMINQVIPQRLAVWVLQKATRRSKESIFPAPYHKCSAGALDDVLESWSTHEIIPLYLGADYFQFFSPLARGYVAYENWAMNGHRRNLASHYLVIAEK
jgi:cyclopropane fatty-acyl-phospholipid synthase-like methyltransferase